MEHIRLVKNDNEKGKDGIDIDIQSNLVTLQKLVIREALESVIHQKVTETISYLHVTC